MQTDGIKPSQGNPVGKYVPAGRAAKPGKSFADALDKAAATGKPIAQAPMGDAPAPSISPLPPESHSLESIRDRLKAGFYNSKNVDEAISDKLSGYFDELA